MDKHQSLADYLGVQAASPAEPQPRPEDVTDPQQFAQAVLSSPEFRRYIVDGLVLGTLPSAVLIRVMDLAGWAKPPERVEHTGRDGKPIETITEVRRVVVHLRCDEDLSDPSSVRDGKYQTH